MPISADGWTLCRCINCGECPWWRLHTQLQLFPFSPTSLVCICVYALSESCLLFACFFFIVLDGSGKISKQVYLYFYFYLPILWQLYNVPVFPFFLLPCSQYHEVVWVVRLSRRTYHFCDHPLPVYRYFCYPSIWH
jgi:hypothetical protein